MAEPCFCRRAERWRKQERGEDGKGGELEQRLEQESKAADRASANDGCVTMQAPAVVAHGRKDCWDDCARLPFAGATAGS